MVERPLGAYRACVRTEVNGDLPRLVNFAPGVPHDLFRVHAAAREAVNHELAKHRGARVSADARGAREFGDVRALGDDRGLKLLKRLDGRAGEFGKFRSGEASANALLNLLRGERVAHVVGVVERRLGPGVSHRMPQFVGDSKGILVPAVGLHNKMQTVVRGPHEVHTRHAVSVPR